MPLIVNIIAILIIIIAGIYNIRSLVRKMKANPTKKFDLLVGIVIWTAAISILIYLFIETNILP
jgi:hypothetical protein